MFSCPRVLSYRRLFCLEKHRLQYYCICTIIAEKELLRAKGYLVAAAFADKDKVNSEAILIFSNTPNKKNSC